MGHVGRATTECRYYYTLCLSRGNNTIHLRLPSAYSHSDYLAQASAYSHSDYLAKSTNILKTGITFRGIKL